MMLGVDLFAEQQQGGVARLFRFKIRIEGRADDPGGDRPGMDALPCGEQRIGSQGRRGDNVH